MKLVHEAVIERSEILETLGARFLKTFKEKNLCSGVYLFQELTQLSHGVTGWSTQDIVHEAFDKLLSKILASGSFPEARNSSKGMACAANGIGGGWGEVTPVIPQLVMEEEVYA
jgi:hypothetical protein